MKRNARNGPNSRLMLVIVITLLLMTFASAVSGAESSAAKAQPDGSALQQLVDATGGQVNFSQNQATGTVGFLRITGDTGLSLTQSGSAQAEADAFLQQYGSVFGITDAGSELVLLRSDTDSIGMQHRSYQQVYQGVPVLPLSCAST
jgi:Zn-dependent metalloprotease